jgi:hypothetical protein
MRQDSNQQLKSLNDGLSEFFLARERRKSALSAVPKLYLDDKKLFECADHVAGMKSASVYKLKSSQAVRKIWKMKSSKKVSVALKSERKA